MEEYFGNNMKNIDKKGQINYLLMLTTLYDQDDNIFDEATAILWIESTKTMLVANRNTSIYVFYLDQNKILKPKITLNGHLKAVKRIKYSNRTKSVYSCAYDNNIITWNPSVKKAMNSFSAFKDTDKIIKDIFLPDTSDVLCAILENGQIIIWDLSSFEKLSYKTYGTKAMLYPYDTKQIIIHGGFSVQFIEYSQQFAIQKLY